MIIAKEIFLCKKKGAVCGAFLLLVFKFFNKGADRVSAVAYLIFDFRVKFCGGAAIFRKIELRIIA